MSNKVAMPDANKFIQASPYVPRQLIIRLMGVDGGNEAQKALQNILELRVLRTKIKAVESNSGALVDDVQEIYQQEFVVGEQYGKAVYTSLRGYREMGLPIEILMFEPDPTHTKVVDAWLLKKGRIQHVRTSTFPHRDVTTTVAPLAEGDAPFPGTVNPVHTTFSILGELHHQLNLIDLAQLAFDEMNQVIGTPTGAFNPAA